MREALGRGVGAMRGREGVIDINIAKLRKRGDKVWVVFGLGGVEPRVFEQKNIAVLHRADRTFGYIPGAVGGKADIALKLALEFDRHGFQRILRVRAAFWASKMGENDDLGFPVRNLADIRKHALDARCIRDPKILHRDIEIGPNEHALACDVDIVKRAEHIKRRGPRHSSFPMTAATSAMRFENPHSLSYHDMTRTNVPSMTLV
jgi:hypothetical protein